MGKRYSAYNPVHCFIKQIGESRMESLLPFFLIAIGFTAWGFFGPALTGGTYHEAKWRIVGPLLILGLLWIILTPNGCSVG